MSPTLADEIQFAHGPRMASRIALAPLTNLQSHPDGTLSDDELNWLVKRTDGGFSLTMTCAAHVQPSGQGFAGQLGAFSDIHLPGLSRLAHEINRRGSLSAMQLQHSGIRANPKLTGGVVLAPWDDAEKKARALTTDEVEQLIADFIAASVRAEKAGFNGVELHGAHGYMLAEFLDDRNQRSDRFGGAWENRTRIYFDVIDGIRAATGKDFQLGLRLSPERYGYSIANARPLAQQLMTGGKLDYLDMSLWDCFKDPDEEGFKGRPLIDWFTELARGTCKLGVAGKITSAATAQNCINHNADFVLIGRAAILHHDFPKQSLADSGFVSREFPVSRDYLASEGVGPAFAEYLATQWQNYVSD